MPIGLYALALGGFGIGLTEFVILGLLPTVADDFNVSPTAAGWLITGYALSVAFGSIAVTSLVTRLPRKMVLLSLLVVFVVGNVLSAIAPTFEVMLAGRIVAALAQGAFFGIGSVLASTLVPANKKGQAIAVMFTGLTLANVLGVPIGTFLGQAFGWHSTFWSISIIGVLAFVGIALAIPRSETRDRTTIRQEFAAFKSGQVWLSLLITILSNTGFFAAFAYISYTLTEVSGFPLSAVPWLLLLLGAALFVGNLLGGRFADKSIDKTLIVVGAAGVLVLAGFALTAHIQILALVWIVLLGGFWFASVPPLQMRVMKYAHADSALVAGGNIGAFTLGSALGAWLGGLTIEAGLGFTSPIWAGVPVVAVGLIVLIVAAVREKRRPTAWSAPAEELDPGTTDDLPRAA